MSKAIKGTVRCDADGCGWQAEGETLSDWFDKPCPMCGAELLDLTDRVLIGFLNILGRFGIVRSATKDEEGKPGVVRVGTDRRKK